MDCKFEATAPNVQELDEKNAKHAREVHNLLAAEPALRRAYLGVGAEPPSVPP